jgi:hypothetical protein
MPECFPIQVPTNSSPILISEGVRLVVNGVPCLDQSPIWSPEPQWDVLPRHIGMAMPAKVIRRNGVPSMLPSSFQSTKPMASITKQFIQRVLVPILVARYIADRRGNETSDSSSEMAL